LKSFDKTTTYQEKIIGLVNIQSLISIIDIMFTGKENYKESSRNIRHTLIFNELWKGICEREDDNAPTKPTLNKELAIWENGDNKDYALINAFVSEEVSPM